MKSNITHQVEFIAGVYAGLGKAIVTDPDVLLLATMGVLLGSRSNRLKGLGKAMGLYIAIRRADGIAGHFAHQLQTNRRVMSTTRPDLADRHWHGSD